MNWLDMIGPMIRLPFFQQLTLVGIIVGTMRNSIKKLQASAERTATSVEGLRSELHEFKDDFRSENRSTKKVISEVKGEFEAIKYQVFELQLDVKQLKRGV